LSHARLGGDRESRGHPLGAEHASHLFHVRALAAKQVAHLARALGEVVHELSARGGGHETASLLPTGQTPTQMPDNEILLARHGQTEWSVNGRHTGHTDIPLTDEGRRQGEALAPRFAGLDLALVLSSPLSRALDTCRLAGLGDSAVQDGDLKEWDYGDYEGVTTDEIRESRPGWTVWTHGAAGGESSEQIGARADRVIERLEATDGRCVVFAHGHILRVLAARWIGLPASAGSLLALSTATLSGLGHDRETRMITLWNDQSHLG